MLARTRPSHRLCKGNQRLPGPPAVPRFHHRRKESPPAKVRSADLPAKEESEGHGPCLSFGCFGAKTPKHFAKH